VHQVGNQIYSQFMMHGQKNIVTLHED